MKRHNVPMYLLLVLIMLFSVVTSNDAVAWPETDDDDLIIDAPWRTMRDYLPVVFFAPELEGLSVIREINVSNWDSATGTLGDTIFRDANNAALKFIPGEGQAQVIDAEESATDIHRCRNIPVEIIDPLGRVREGIQKGEVFKSFWHYIARIPVACIGLGNDRGRRGVHFIRAEIKVQQAGDTPFGKSIFKVMRIAVDSRPLPRFETEDRHYDVHIHTIAEQTQLEVTNVDAARKAFGGPIAQIIDAAYAIGLVDTQLRNGNWSDFRDLIATTDHNVFFSSQCKTFEGLLGEDIDSCYDDGSGPLYGPTANRGGSAGEFAWYRANLGILGAEEVTLTGAGNTDGLALGSHYLLYGAPHIEGPWHGGSLGLEDLNLTGIPSSASLTHVHKRAAETNGFGYAAHPFSSSIGWLEPLRHQAIGTESSSPSVSPIQPLTNGDGSEFIFKGLQLWNGLGDFETQRSRNGVYDGFPFSAAEKLDPFTVNQPPAIVEFRKPGDSEVTRVDAGNQLFLSNRGDRNNNSIPDHLESREFGLFHYYRHLMSGLTFSFDPHIIDPRRQFIRKLYISAATDAHGDFNFATSSSATVLAEAGDIPGFDSLFPDKNLKISSNAFGRVRTYTLTSERLTQKRLTPLLDQPGAVEEGATPEGAVLPLPSEAEEGASETAATVHAALATPSVTPEKAAAESVAAYRHGNTILTSNPICKFNIDANCRMNAGGESGGWHDNVCRWENRDGQIGGKGKLDGGGTALFVRNQKELWTRNVWDDLPTYQPDRPTSGSIRYELVHIVHGGNDTTAEVASKGRPLSAAPRRRPHHTQLPLDVDAPGHSGNAADLPQAVLMKGYTVAGECVTNPIWIAPVEFTVRKSSIACPIETNSLEVSLKFSMSMDSTLRRLSDTGDGPQPGGGAHFGEALESELAIGELGPVSPNTYRGLRVKLYPLDRNGASTGRGFELTGVRNWKSNAISRSSGGVSYIVKNASFRVHNETEIPCPEDSWDAVNHQPSSSPIVKAYAIVVSDLRDSHGNRLNDIGKTIQYGLQTGDTDAVILGDHN